MLCVRSPLSLFISVSVFLSLLPCPQTVKAQDLVASEDVAGGSSVFVFRESRKKAQARFAGVRVAMASGATGRSTRSNAQIAAINQKRRLAAIAARKQAVAAAAANRKIKLSNTLTAKAEEFLDNNQTDTAITNFREALVQNPKNMRASDGLSNALTAKGIEVAGDANNEAALVYFNEAVKRDLKNDVAYAKMGAIYDARGKDAEAIANYEKALAINSEFSTLYPPLGVLYMEAGEVAKADSALQKADRAGIDIPDTRFLHGMVAFKNNQNSEALAGFDRTLALDSRHADAQYYRGQTLARMGQPYEAIAAYKNTLEVEPNYAPASFDLGVAYYNTGDYNNAAVAYQNVIRMEPKNAQAHANLASTYRQLERYPEANAEYQIASKDIKTADLYSEWGYSLGKANEWDQSVERLKTAAELSPQAVDNSNVGWAYYNAGNAQATQKNDAAAKQNYELAKQSSQKATEQDPKLEAPLLNLGSTHNKLGEFQLAVNVLQRALGLHSNWLIATNQLGVGFRGMNDLPNAVATFKQAVNIDGNNTFSLYNLGEAYYASGNKKEAKKINDRLKKLDPTLASQLDGIISGRVVIDAAKQKIDQKVPKVPRLPF